MPTWLRIIVSLKGNVCKHTNTAATIYSHIIMQIFSIRVFDNVFHCRGKKESHPIVWQHCTVISRYQYSSCRSSDTRLVITEINPALGKNNR